MEHDFLLFNEKYLILCILQVSVLGFDSVVSRFEILELARDNLPETNRTLFFIQLPASNFIKHAFVKYI